LDFALALLSGALLALSFPKFGHSSFGWIALAPLLVALSYRRQDFRRSFGLGLVAGFVYFAGTLYWFVVTLTTFGGLSTPLAVVASAMGIAYLALYPALFAVIQARLARALGKPALALAPAVWVATEMARTYSPLDFPWELLGYSQATVLPIAQVASVVGVYGLSALVASVSTAAAYAMVDTSRRRWIVCGVVGLTVCGTAIWGTLRIRDRALTRQGTAVRVAVLQGNIPQEQKWDPAMADAIMDRYIGMTREAIGRNAQFILWPESATPVPYEQDPRRGELIRRLAREAQVTILIGSDQFEPAAPGLPAPSGLAAPAKAPPPPAYNAAYLIRPDGSTAAVYRKIHLVPFGEYVPFKRLLFFVGPLVDAVSDFTPGAEATLLPVKGRMVSTAICYEVIYAGLMRSFVTRGSELLTTITNDAWYGWSSAAYQHWEQASLRSIEEGRYLVRAANTGISGFVDPYGRVLQRSNMFQSAVMAEDVRFLTGKTIYNRLGDVVGWLSVALTLAALAATRRRR
jgi:apolipoprotein N-acyltransferase